MDRVINRVIPNFVALCNKQVFCLIFTRSEVKNQVGEVDFTLVGLTVSLRIRLLQPCTIITIASVSNSQ